MLYHFLGAKINLFGEDQERGRESDPVIYSQHACYIVKVVKP